MIDENINKIRSDIPDYVELIAISKTKPNEDIMKAYENGHRSFGENKIQEMSICKDNKMLATPLIV